MAAPTTGKRVVFTGGSGKAGRHVIPYLLERGHSVLNLDLQPLPHPTVYTLKTDLTDAGQVFNALTSNFHIQQYENPRHSDTVPVGPIDAVIHFAAYARNMLVPDNECFKGNVLSTYNVIEAACKLGVKKVVIASSETVYGVCFAQGDCDYHSFPLEEDYDCGRFSGVLVGRRIWDVGGIWQTQWTHTQPANYVESAALEVSIGGFQVRISTPYA